MALCTRHQQGKQVVYVSLTTRRCKQDTPPPLSPEYVDQIFSIDVLQSTAAHDESHRLSFCRMKKYRFRFGSKVSKIQSPQKVVTNSYQLFSRYFLLPLINLAEEIKSWDSITCWSNENDTPPPRAAPLSAARECLPK